MTDEATMTLTVDGVTTAPFTLDDLKAATAQVKQTMREPPEDEAVRERVVSMAARELRQFVDRYERLEEEKKDIADQAKEVLAEAKGRGYSVRALREIIRIRKRDAAEVSEHEAIVALYREALGL